MIVSNQNHKETYAAFEAQLRTTQGLLRLQTQEAQSSQEHMTVLNGQIDVLRRALADKQENVIKLQGQLQQKMEQLEELHKVLDQHQIDRLAFYNLEKQNAQLLDRLKEKQAKIAELEVEIRFLSEQGDDGLVIEQTKALRLNELEITGPFHRTQLSVQLEEAVRTNNDLASKLALATSDNDRLQKELQWSESRRIDQVARAKAIEFQQLMQLDKIDSDLRHMEIDAEHLQKANVTETQRGKELAAQLRSTVQTVDRVQQICGAVIDVAEKDEDVMRRREKQLIQQNYRLQEEKHLLGTALQRTAAKIPVLPQQVSPQRQAMELLHSPSRSREISKSSASKQRSPIPTTKRAVTALPSLTVSLPTKKPAKASSLSMTAPAASGPRALLSEVMQYIQADDPTPAPAAPQSPMNVQAASVSTAQPTDNDIEVESSGEGIEMSLEHDVAATLHDFRSIFIDRMCGLYLTSARYAIAIEQQLQNQDGAGMPNESEVYEEPDDWYPQSTNSVRTRKSQIIPGDSSFLQVLPLSRAQLQNMDFPKIIDWFRRLPTMLLATIDLSHNSFGGQGLFDTIAWLLALSSQAILQRATCLCVDMRHNRVKSEDIRKAVGLLQTRAEFVLVKCKSPTDQTIVVYGSAGPGSKEEMKLLVSIDVNEQRRRQSKSKRAQRALTVKFQQPIEPLSEVMDNGGALTPGQLTEPSDRYDGVYPRDYIMDMVVYS